jgi:hypothetical protein
MFQFQKHSEAKNAYQAAKPGATASKWLKRIIRYIRRQRFGIGK